MPTSKKTTAAVEAAQQAREPRFATVKAAAAHFMVSESTVRRWMRKHEIRIYSYGKRLVRVDLDEIADLIAAGGR